MVWRQVTLICAWNRCLVAASKFLRPPNTRFESSQCILMCFTEQCFGRRRVILNCSYSCRSSPCLPSEYFFLTVFPLHSRAQGGALGVERMYYNLKWAGQRAWQQVPRQIWSSPLPGNQSMYRCGGPSRIPPMQFVSLAFSILFADSPSRCLEM